MSTYIICILLIVNQFKIKLHSRIRTNKSLNLEKFELLISVEKEDEDYQFGQKYALVVDDVRQYYYQNKL